MHLTPPAADSVHLWQVDLGTAPNNAALLAADEKERAARFHFDRDRRRFIVCRGALRRILGAYLRREPDELTFHTGEHGRPHLAGKQVLEFNVTHSGDLALIAIAASGPLGVDVEAPRDTPNASDLARRYFHVNELREIEATAPADRSRVFLQCWTRKEAVLKSTGRGLAIDPRCIDVGASNAERVLQWPELLPGKTLCVVSLSLSEGYVAAWAATHDVRRCELRRFGS